MKSGPLMMGRRLGKTHGQIVGLTRERDEARALLRAILDEACCLSPLDGTCRQIQRPHDEWCAICRARVAMEKVEP